MRIYIATPYEAMLKKGFSLDEVIKETKKGIKKAKNRFNSDDHIFSPVIEFSKEHKDMPRDEVMSLCFKELSMCDVIYIPNLTQSKNSDGIKAEMEYAKNNSIKIISEIWLSAYGQGDWQCYLCIRVPRKQNKRVKIL